MTDAEIIECARHVRETVLNGSSSESMCWGVCAPLAEALCARGMQVDLVKGDLGEILHYWLRLPDGRALDPTCDQFVGSLLQDAPDVYLGHPTEIHRATSDPPLRKPPSFSLANWI